MRVCVAAITAIGLGSACAPEPPPPPPVLADAFAPVHVTTPAGVVVPASCLSARASGYGPWPPRCTVDAAFGAQIEHGRRSPGPRPSGPAAQAAEAYLGGSAAVEAPAAEGS